MSTIKKILAVFFTIFVVFPAFSNAKKDLLKAVEANDEKKVKKILSVNSSYSTASFDEDKNSILMISLENNPSVKMVEILLRAGCSPDIKNKDGQTALMIACKNKCDSEILEKIINFNAMTKGGKAKRILLKDKDGRCCFDYTSEGEDVYKTLIQYADDPVKVAEAKAAAETAKAEAEKAAAEEAEQVAEETAEPPVEEPAAEIEPEEVTAEITEEQKLAAEEVTEAEIVAEPAAEVTEVLPAVITAETAAAAAVVAEEIKKEEEALAEEVPLEQTAVAEEPKAVETPHSIEYDETVEVPKIDYYNINRPEYLFEEIDTDVTEVEEKKFKKIENPNALDNAGRTRLMNAIMNDDANLCYALLESGARVDIRDKDGWTALMYACRYAKTPDIVELLFNYGAKLNDKSTFNLSVLQITAAYCESVPVLVIILNQAKEQKLELTSPFVTALKTERPAEIIKSFIKFIPNINKTVSGKTPLMYAAENYESTDVIKLLLENGADPYIISTESKNAFSYAKENTKITHDSIYWSLNVSSSRKR